MIIPHAELKNIRDEALAPCISDPQKKICSACFDIALKQAYRLGFADGYSEVKEQYRGTRKYHEDELKEIYENRIRGWKAYARIAWKENRKLKVYLGKEKQRVLAIQQREAELISFIRSIDGTNGRMKISPEQFKVMCDLLVKHPTKARDGGDGK